MISTPQAVADFFNKYPQAASVFSDEDASNIYLNQFKGKGVIAAKQDSKRLYEVTSADIITRVYPISFLYSIQQDTSVEDITEVTIGDESVSVLTQDASGISSAFDAVFAASNLVAQPTEVNEVSTGVFDIRIVSSTDVVVTLTSGASTAFSLTKTFL